MSHEQKTVERARKAFLTGRSKSLEHRIRQLKNLQRFIVERQKEIADAIKKDLNKVSIICLWLNLSGCLLICLTTIHSPFSTPPE